MSQGDRFNEGKPKWSLVPQSSLVPMVRVLEFGAKKYGDYNWAKGLSIREICESLKRHLDAFMEGEDDDPESKLSHIGHIQYLQTKVYLTKIKEQLKLPTCRKWN